VPDSPVVRAELAAGVRRRNSAGDDPSCRSWPQTPVSRLRRSTTSPRSRDGPTISPCVRPDFHVESARGFRRSQWLAWPCAAGREKRPSSNQKRPGQSAVRNKLFSSLGFPPCLKCVDLCHTTASQFGGIRRKSERPQKPCPGRERTSAAKCFPEARAPGKEPSAVT